MKFNAISFSILSVLSMFSFSMHAYVKKSDTQQSKILHISFHKGCVDDFAQVAQELGLDVTSWYVLSADLPREHFDGITTAKNGNAVYNIGYERAKKVWDLHKDYFDQFDVIVTSDTAPLSRIFLQNGWKKPLIIWICNRFDYFDGPSRDCVFPDAHYYDLFRAATKQENVQIISYTPYEHHYARAKNVEIGTFTIRPIGCEPRASMLDFKSAIPKEINKQDALFLYPRMNQSQINYVKQQCSQVGVDTYSGVYKGPDDLIGFKGVIYFPYQWSNLALFENIQRGIVHFVPSEKFMHQLAAQRANVRIFALHDLHLCDWYCSEFRDLFVYFDSWQDLKQKIDTTNYQVMSEKIKKAGQEHRKKELEKWRHVFNECTR